MYTHEKGGLCADFMSRTNNSVWIFPLWCNNVINFTPSGGHESNGKAARHHWIRPRALARKTQCCVEVKTGMITAFITKIYCAFCDAIE